MPAKYSLLHARSIPSKGGNTEFAYMRAAYDALDQETKDLIEDLVCEHSQMFSRGQARLHRFHARGARALQAGAPAAGAHASEHGAQIALSLLARRHHRRLAGAGGKALLLDLTEAATQREFVYSHKWRVGDLVMWDNRQTMHRARPFPHDEPRDVRRTTLMGDAPTVAQQAA